MSLWENYFLSFITVLRYVTKRFRTHSKKVWRNFLYIKIVPFISSSTFSYLLQQLFFEHRIYWLLFIVNKMKTFEISQTATQLLNEWLQHSRDPRGSQNVTDSIPEFRPVVEFTDKIQLGWTTVCPFLNAARGRYQEIRLRLDVERLTLGLIRLIL